MKRELYITYFLLLTSILMLSVPVIPHHHHGDEAICMKSDLSQEGSSQYPVDNGNCCCNSGCITTHFFEQVPTSFNELLLLSLPNIITLFSTSYSPDIDILSWKQKGENKDNTYQETLHSTYITRARGFRAPPRLL